MSKLVKVNSVLFTIMAVLIIIFLSVVTLQMLINRNKTTIRDDYPNTDMISNNKARELIKKNLRENIISINSVILIDSSKSLYYVPVSLLRLKKPEEAVSYEKFGSSEPRVPIIHIIDLRLI